MLDILKEQDTVLYTSLTTYCRSVGSLHFLDFSRLIISSLDGGDVFAVFYTEGIARQCSLSDRVSSEASKKNFLLLLLLSSNISSPNWWSLRSNASHM